MRRNYLGHPFELVSKTSSRLQAVGFPACTKFESSRISSFSSEDVLKEYMDRSSSDFPSPRSSMSSEKKSEGLQTFPSRRKTKSIEMDVGCATFWSQQQVLQAPKRSIWYRCFLKIKQYMGVEPHLP